MVTSDRRGRVESISSQCRHPRSRRLLLASHKVLRQLTPSAGASGSRSSLVSMTTANVVSATVSLAREGHSHQDYPATGRREQ